MHGSKGEKKNSCAGSHKKVGSWPCAPVLKEETKSSVPAAGACDPIPPCAQVPVQEKSPPQQEVKPEFLEPAMPSVPVMAHPLLSSGRALECKHDEGKPCILDCIMREEVRLPHKVWMEDLEDKMLADAGSSDSIAADLMATPFYERAWPEQVEFWEVFVTELAAI